jgi:hypothetical protein
MISLPSVFAEGRVVVLQGLPGEISKLRTEAASLLPVGTSFLRGQITGI